MLGHNKLVEKQGSTRVSHRKRLDSIEQAATQFGTKDLERDIKKGSQESQPLV